jgi:pyruvate dehydrogenase phosphatase
MTTLSVPSAPITSRRPLSNHGMPKPPRVSSPNQPHRFSGRSISIKEESSGYTSPRTPGLMSPPMSARSFGTFIDSEPSTPAYSPRMDYEWDHSNTVLLRPMSSSSEPSSPSEPVWDMIKPMEVIQQAPAPLRTTRKGPTVLMREVPPGPRLASPPPKRVKLPPKSRTVIPVEVYRPSPQVNDLQLKEQSNEVKVPREQPTTTSTAPFGKLASRMKMMLRRKSTNDGKKKEKKEKDYYDPVEDIHWTEM